MQATGLFAQVARAVTTNQPNGHFTFTAKALTDCPLGAVVCSSGTFTGRVQGPFEFTITSLLPSPTVGVNYFSGKLVLHTGSGDIRCDLDGALNILPTSQGEFGEICVITGGTGTYNRATGHLRLYGVSSPNLITPAGTGDYRGTIITT